MRLLKVSSDNQLSAQGDEALPHMMKSGFGKAKGRGEERGVQGELMLFGYAWSGGQITTI